ncbi:hypothetical protein T11_18056 [Trichinella zimbabwensis]|uniref:Uncharacterized protein n=1 Tax=Trichinella zimbabwensis TaxID=268475 RepID=A0A0V1HK08_9BILA|nr:hypothetical protein T11_18056 [Trichinella zimbabwensis]
MKGKQLLVPGWENLQDLISAPPITLSQKPHTSLGSKNQYIIGRSMIYLNLLTGICCSLLGSGVWFLPSFREAGKSPGPAVVHYVTGLVPSWKITSRRTACQLMVYLCDWPRIFCGQPFQFIKLVVFVECVSVHSAALRMFTDADHPCSFNICPQDARAASLNWKRNGSLVILHNNKKFYGYVKTIFYRCACPTFIIAICPFEGVTPSSQQLSNVKHRTQQEEKENEFNGFELRFK